MGPFTGNASSYSKAQIGLDAYYKWVNDQGGVNGRKIETVLEDYACDSAKGVAAVKKLIHQDKVFMLHGNSCSAVAMAIKPIVVEAGIPWVVAHAANGAISSPPTKNIFHGVPVGKTMGIAMGQFVASKPGLAKVAVISHTDDWAKSYCGPANEYLASKNIKPVIEVAFERGQTDSTAQTLKIKQANPDFVIACLYEAETAIFLKDAKKYGLNAPVMGTAGTDLENTLKRVGDLDTVANYYVPHMYADNLDGPRLKKFADILKKYYPNEIGDRVQPDLDGRRRGGGGGAEALRPRPHPRQVHRRARPHQELRHRRAGRTHQLVALGPRRRQGRGGRRVRQRQADGAEGLGETALA